MTPLIPTYQGNNLVNLVAELEVRLTGDSPSAALDNNLSSMIPSAATYVLVLFDGLGTSQLSHPSVRDLARHLQASIQAPFPTTTSVSLATIATGLAPSGHGILGHLVWIPEVNRVVNSLKWRDLTGSEVEIDTESLLPRPNLWERLGAAGIQSFTVQPSPFEGTPLSKMLYRGTGFEGISDNDDFIETVSILAREPGRLMFAYFPDIDFAAHMSGQNSEEYRRTLDSAATIWRELCRRVPDEVGLIGTADHGHVDYPKRAKIRWRSPVVDSLTVFGDPRVVYLKGDMEVIEEAASEIGVPVLSRHKIRSWWGPGELEGLEERLPDACVLAPDGRVLLPKGFDGRLTGYHGGLTHPEIEIPLLVRR